MAHFPPAREGTKCATELTVHARRAIVAVPPTLAGRIAYDPPLPGMRDQLTQRMPQGTVIEVQGPKHEFLLPFRSEYVKVTDREQRRLVVDVPPELMT